LNIGAHIVVGGLVVQLLFFGFFIGVAAMSDLAMRRVPTPPAQTNAQWRKQLMGLYGASILIMIRSIFRVVEYLQGFNGYIMEHEVYLYVFDAAMMLAVMFMFNCVHPSEVRALLYGGLASKGSSKLCAKDAATQQSTFEMQSDIERRPLSGRCQELDRM
jgi:hypothetical protein